MSYHSRSFTNEYKHFFRSVMFFFIIIFLILVIVVAIIFTDISRMSTYTYDSVTKIPHNRTGLVLGTSKYLAKGGLNDYFVYRIQAATELYKAKKIDYIVVSGDNAHRSYNEPRIMRKALIEAGIPKDKIYLDYAGFRTLDSIVRISRIFRQKQVTIISQDFHNERAIYIARYFGINAIGFNAENTHSSFFTENIREFIARLRCILDLYVFESKPKFLGDSIIIGDKEIDPKHAQFHDSPKTKDTQKSLENQLSNSQISATEKLQSDADAATNIVTSNTNLNDINSQDNDINESLPEHNKIENIENKIDTANNYLTTTPNPADSTNTNNKEQIEASENSSNQEEKLANEQSISTDNSSEKNNNTDSSIDSETESKVIHNRETRKSSLELIIENSTPKKKKHPNRE